MTNIYYICPDRVEPAGGIKVIYQHVNALCNNGLSASIVHFNKGFRCEWFENDVPIRHIKELRPTPTDIIVIPSGWALRLIGFAPGVRKVLINQGSYLTFRGYPIDKVGVSNPYNHPDVIAALVVSEDNSSYLQYVFPTLRVVRVRNYIDFDHFKFCENKAHKIAFMPRKRYEDVEQVINILRYRGVLDSFALAPIHNKTEREVSSILQDSLIFLNFCFEEGWSLPAAEAMACGCIVIGNHGNGAREILLPEFSYPVEQGDIIQFSKTVEDVINMHKIDPSLLKETARKGAEFIKQNYSYTAAETELLNFWRGVLGS